MAVTRIPWGKTPRGREVDLYSLENSSGLGVDIATYGGSLVSLRVPDARGRAADVALGFDGLGGYLAQDWYCGSLVGRVANRISLARFTLDGRTHDLDRNHGRHQLHGGSHGFNTRVWDAEAGETDRGDVLALSLVSPRGDQGYPGELRARAVFTVSRDENVLSLEFEAETDRPTVVNMTCHAYFHLGGGGGDCGGHVLELNSSRFLPTDADLIPTGEIAAVRGTPLDFTAPHALGERWDADFEPLRLAGGYDHCMLLDNNGKMDWAARVEDPTSGRRMEMRTDMPALQFYSGNFMVQGIKGKKGAVYDRRHGFCLEPQAWVDAPNRPEFPSMVLRPGETYGRGIEYRFGAA